MTKKLPPDVPRKPRGSKPGEHRGGRKKGTPNKRTVVKQKLKERIEKGIAEATGLDAKDLLPLDFMLAVMRNKKMPMGFRSEQAKNAAPYVHAKKIAVKAKVRGIVATGTPSDLAAGGLDVSALYRDIMAESLDDEDDED